jgi:hypothetical protein
MQRPGSRDRLDGMAYKDLRQPLRQWAYELPWRVHSKLPEGSCNGCLMVGIDLQAVLLVLMDRLFIYDIRKGQDIDWSI